MIDESGQPQGGSLGAQLQGCFGCLLTALIAILGLVFLIPILLIWIVLAIFGIEFNPITWLIARIMKRRIKKRMKEFEKKAGEQGGQKVIDAEFTVKPSDEEKPEDPPSLNQ